MNLFNPKGQKELTINLDSANPAHKRVSATIPAQSERSIDKITSIVGDIGGRGKLRNPDLQAKTAAIQNEFDQLMQEMVNRRSGLKVAMDTSSAAVDDILDGYYMPGPERKHKSPTRRLIDHKNTTTSHK
jgi:hypothetical protein